MNTFLIAFLVVSTAINVGSALSSYGATYEAVGVAITGVVGDCLLTALLIAVVSLCILAVNEAATLVGL